MDRDTGNWVRRGKQSSGSRPAKRATTYLLLVTCYLPSTTTTYLLFASDYFFGDILQYRNIGIFTVPNSNYYYYYYTCVFCLFVSIIYNLKYQLLKVMIFYFSGLPVTGKVENGGPLREYCKCAHLKRKKQNTVKRKDLVLVPLRSHLE